MKKVLIALFISCLTFGVANAQEEAKKDTSWKSGAVFALNFTQVSLTNWAAGGQSSLSGVALINAFKNYAKGRHTWDNTITLGYGLIKNQNEDPFKNEDRIEINSKYGYDLQWKHWYGAAFLNFRTQFDEGLANPGDKTKISDFMAPGYLTAGLGFDYKPNANFSVLIAPVTAKITFVTDDLLAAQGAFGVEKGVITVDSLGNATILEDGDNIRSEFGGIVSIAYKQKLMENIQFGTKIDMFSNYSEDPDHIDVNWEALIAAQVNKYIQVTFGTNLIYDHDIKIQEFNDDATPKLNADGNPIIGPRTQFKTVFGLGFTYAF